MRKRPCRRCGLGQPHPFAHWHVWCRYCRTVKVYRGACCKACHADALKIVSDLFKDGGTPPAVPEEAW